MPCNHARITPPTTNPFAHIQVAILAPSQAQDKARNVVLQLRTLAYASGYKRKRSHRQTTKARQRPPSPALSFVRTRAAPAPGTRSDPRWRQTVGRGNSNPCERGIYRPIRTPRSRPDRSRRNANRFGFR